MSGLAAETLKALNGPDGQHMLDTLSRIRFARENGAVQKVTLTKESPGQRLQATVSFWFSFLLCVDVYGLCRVVEWNGMQRSDWLVGTE